MEYTQSEIIRGQALTASTAYPFDLGIQGVSAIWIEIQAQQNAANTIPQPDDFLACVSNISVSVGGQNVINGRAKDLARLGAIIAGVPIMHTAAANAANAQGCVGFWLPFGRWLLDPAEGFPAVKRGMLQITVTAASAFTPLTAPHVTIHQFEVPGNRFTRYNKYTMRTATPSATGYYDFPLPIGNYLRGVLAVGSTGYRSYASLGTFTELILLVNNTEHYATGGVYGVYKSLMLARMDPGPQTHMHGHLENTAGAYAQNASTDGGLNPVTPVELLSGFIDLDPRRDDSFTLDTAGVNLLALRANMNTAEQAWVYAYESVRVV